MFYPYFYPEEDRDFIESVKISGEIRSTGWLYNKMKEGFFWFVDEGDEPKARIFAGQIDKMITILNQVYGENWDFDLRRDPKYYDSDEDDWIRRDGYGLYVVLHFPELTISNSNDAQHETKNLFVALHLLPSELNIQDSLCFEQEIMGCRSSYTYKEWLSGWSHSHLMSNRPKAYRHCLKGQEFCLGQNELLDQMSSLMEEWTEEMLELFLMSIDNFVRWESLEGVPYNSIENLVDGGTLIQNIRTSINDSDIREIGDSLRHAMTSLPVDFYYDGTRPRIKRNQRFNDFLKDLINDNVSNDYISKILVAKVGDQYYGYEIPEIFSEAEAQRMIMDVVGCTPHFYFRDKDIIMSIEPFTGGEISQEQFKVHPKLIDYAAKKYEDELYQAIVKRSVYERHNQTGHAA